MALGETESGWRSPASAPRGPSNGTWAPSIVAAAGPLIEERYWEFFGGSLRNRNTRRAYLRAIEDFLVFLESKGVGTLAEIRPLHVAAHVEALTRSHAPATVKQRLAAIRALLDWMTLGQTIPSNPAASVRGPRHVVRRGSTPVLAREEAARIERQRCDREIAVEQERAKTAIEEREKDLVAAQQESHGYSEDLDRLETERAKLHAQLQEHRNELSEERDAKAHLSEEPEELRAKLAEAERAIAEVARQKELLEISKRTATKLEAQLTAASEAHRSDLAESRRAHREELDAFRSDYKDIQTQARETAAELSEAKATIRQLLEQISQGARPPQSRENTKN